MPKHAPNCTFLTRTSLTGMAALLVFVSMATAADRTNVDEKSIEITTQVSDSPASIRTVNSEDFGVVVKLRNTTDEEVIVSPFLSVKLFDADYKPVPRSKNIGRSGFRRTGSALEEISFVSIPAGKTHEIKINLQHYANDPLMVAGWRIEEAGEYRLEIRYHFDRQHAKKTFGKGCLNIDAPEKPWNRALEIDESFEVKFQVN